MTTDNNKISRQNVLEALGEAQESQEDWSSALQFIERFVGQLEKVQGIITNIAAARNGESPSPKVSGELPGKSNGMSAIEVYQTALQILTSMPGDTAVNDLVTHLKDNKDIVLRMIRTKTGE